MRPSKPSSSNAPDGGEGSSPSLFFVPALFGNRGWRGILPNEFAILRDAHPHAHHGILRTDASAVRVDVVADQTLGRERYWLGANRLRGLSSQRRHHLRSRHALDEYRLSFLFAELRTLHKENVIDGEICQVAHRDVLEHERVGNLFGFPGFRGFRGSLASGRISLFFARGNLHFCWRRRYRPQTWRKERGEEQPAD